MHHAVTPRSIVSRWSLGPHGHRLRAGFSTSRIKIKGENHCLARIRRVGPGCKKRSDYVGGPIPGLARIKTEGPRLGSNLTVDNILDVGPGFTLYVEMKKQPRSSIK